MSAKEAVHIRLVHTTRLLANTPMNVDMALWSEHASAALEAADTLHLNERSINFLSSQVHEARLAFALIARLADGTEAGERAYQAYRELTRPAKTQELLRKEIIAGLRNAHEHCFNTMSGDHGAMTVMRLEQAIEELDR